jgi:hypothetical protein
LESEHFRKNAADCFRWAQDARNLHDQTAWLSMAQFWLQLARYAEEQETRGLAQTAARQERTGCPDPAEPED